MSNYSDFVITERLIDLLKKTFPDVVPDHPLGEFEQGKIVGRREVINKLKHIAKGSILNVQYPET